MQRSEMSSHIGVNMKLCQGKDVLERMNYLYQASHLMALRSKNPVAASYYGNIMVGCAKKAVLRLNPDVKRTVCKSCQSPLIPGETARVRLVSRPMKMLKWTCLVCNAIKKYPTKRGYKLWGDQPEALVEIFDYTPKMQEVNCSSRLDKTGKSPEPTNSSSLSDCKNLTKDKIFRKNEDNSSNSIEESNINSFDELVSKQDKDVKSECEMILD